MNYENFCIPQELQDSYSEMVADLTERFYLTTTRYTTSGFFARKARDALNRRRVAPHIYDTRNEARAHLRTTRRRFERARRAMQKGINPLPEWRMG